MNRYVCLHGHFYQPPRENPWLEAIEPQDSAYPYANWNERIAAECYAPNIASRILDADNRIIEIVNNYAKISFDFGPTLLSWMEKYAPAAYGAIIEADMESRKKFSGHGAAIAQVYNHMIMPLANARDKRTQILWGLYDFQKRFGRKSEGMWLSETAVDIETLEILSEYDVKFTILAPHQAKRVRKIGTKIWKDVAGAKVDPTMPYLCHLPSGRTIALFFYDGPVAHDIAFGPLLNDGLNFANRILGVAAPEPRESQLVHIATDGETFGHHHRFGDMALSYCLSHIESHSDAHLTVYAEYLKKYPPAWEVDIIENTSWSCCHGVERWRADCGCSISSHPGWTQKWRVGMRETFDWLRDTLIPVYEKEMSAYVADPWELRDKYIQVILDRSPESMRRFLSEHVADTLSPEDTVKVLKLLEMQRHAMLMYTSCGWFFDDISGIEAAQVLQYATRVVQLAEDITGDDLEAQFISRLKRIPSNVPELATGAGVYDAFVRPLVVNLPRVGAHYALSALFEEYPDEAVIHCYTINRLEYKSHAVEHQGLVIGRAHIRSHITLEEDTVSFAVSYLGGHNLSGRVSNEMTVKTFEDMYKEIKAAFLKGDNAEVIQLTKQYLGEHYYSLQHLFKSEQDKVLGIILDSTLKEIEALYRQIYELHYPIMQLEKDLRITLPKVLGMTAAFILSRDLQALLEDEQCDADQLRKKVDEAKKWSLELDREKIGFVASRRINNLMKQFAQSPEDLVLLQRVETVLRILTALHLDLNLWETQNIHFAISKSNYAKMKKRSETGDQYAQKWIAYLTSLEDCMRIRST